MKTTILALSALALTLLAGAARAEPEEAAPPPARETVAPWTITAGYRGSFVTHPGLNAFSNRDYVDSFSLAGSYTVFTAGRFAFTAGLQWDLGGTAAKARGDDASLTVDRFMAALEARYAFAPFLYAFARTAPGAAQLTARLDDPTAPAELVKTSWVPVLDLSAGGAGRLFTAGKGRVGGWLVAEGGYGLAGRASLLLSPDLPGDDPRRTGSTDLGSLVLRGAFLRIGAAVTF